MARRRVVTAEIKEQILGLVIEGETMTAIASQKGMPGRRTIFRELARDEEFAAAYSVAKDIQLAAMEEDLLDIADDRSGDVTIDPETGEERVNHDHIQRSKIRIDTRKWIMARRRPEKYGDRVASEISGPGGGPVQLEHTPQSDMELARKVAFMLAKGEVAMQQIEEGSKDA